MKVKEIFEDTMIFLRVILHGPHVCAVLFKIAVACMERILLMYVLVPFCLGAKPRRNYNSFCVGIILDLRDMV